MKLEHGKKAVGAATHAHIADPRRRAAELAVAEVTSEVVAAANRVAAAGAVAGAEAIATVVGTMTTTGETRT